MNGKPQLSYFQIFNMCFGFLGIQYGYALQNTSASRIFQTLGAEYNELPILWAAAPLTGLIVQPIIGYLSDKTWTRFGRRRPYLLLGAILTTISLLFFPHSPNLWFAAGMLWILDSSINISNEPFRAYIADSLPPEQRATGFAMQSFFIGIGAIVASSFPWILSNWFDVSNTAPEGVVPDALKYSFYFGGTLLSLTVIYTVVTSKEYSPEQMLSFGAKFEAEGGELRNNKIKTHRGHMVALIAGVAALVAIKWLALEPQLNILAGGFVVYALLMYLVDFLQQKGRVHNGFFHIMYDVNHMPAAMKQLAVVQFFSWFSLFAFWIYTVPAVTSYHYGTGDSTSKVYNDGADWVGVLLAIYNVFAALAAFALPPMAKRLGIQKAHAWCLFAGAAGFASFLLIKNPTYLWLSMIGVGIAWAAILSLPYAMLSVAVPDNKLGVYIGIFNFFITIPQLVAAGSLGLLLQYLFANQPIYMMLLAGASWLLAGYFSTRVKL